MAENHKESTGKVISDFDRSASQNIPRRKHKESKKNFEFLLEDAKVINRRNKCRANVSASGWIDKNFSFSPKKHFF